VLKKRPARGGSAHRVTGHGCRRRNPKVSGRIAELKEQAAQGVVIAAQETLERISARARDETEGHEALQLRALPKRVRLAGRHMFNVRMRASSVLHPRLQTFRGTA
jgi:hypothetical protein